MKTSNEHDIRYQGEWLWLQGENRLCCERRENCQEILS